MNKSQNKWPEGVKRTKQRENVLSILQNADKPMSAIDICSKIETNKETAWLSTVYRVLELFVNKSIVVKTNVANNGMAVYEINSFKHKHYAVCVSCHKIFAMDNCPLENFCPKLADEGFMVMGHNLEIYGYCKDCVPK